MPGGLPSGSAAHSLPIMVHRGSTGVTKVVVAPDEGEIVLRSV